MQAFLCSAETGKRFGILTMQACSQLSQLMYYYGCWGRGGARWVTSMLCAQWVIPWHPWDVVILREKERPWNFREGGGKQWGKEASCRVCNEESQLRCAICQHHHSQTTHLKTDLKMIIGEDPVLGLWGINPQFFPPSPYKLKQIHSTA